MAVRVQTQANISFGTMVAAVTATHMRFRLASDNSAPVVVQLSSDITVQGGDVLKINSGDFDVVYPSGGLTDTHMKAVVDSYWASTSFEMDMMTDATTVVTDTGYSQQSYSNWAISTEND